MCSPVSVVVAEIVMQNIEEQALATYRRTIAPQSWHRRRPSFMLFLSSGIWWSHMGQIIGESFREHLGHFMIKVPYTLEFSRRSQGFSEWKVVDVSWLLLAVSSLSFFSVVVAPLGVFSFTAILRSHFLLLLIFNIQWTLLIITLVLGSIFYISVAFFPFY